MGCTYSTIHDDVIKWEHFPRNWPFVREIHRPPVNFPHKGQWRGALMFSLIYAWINDWVNNREAGDLRRQNGHYDVIVMICQIQWRQICLHPIVLRRCYHLPICNPCTCSVNYGQKKKHRVTNLITHKTHWSNFVAFFSFTWKKKKATKLFQWVLCVIRFVVEQQFALTSILFVAYFPGYGWD